MSTYRSSTSMQQFDPHRIAEIIVRLSDGGERRGSGYRITETGVATAAHVISGQRRITVRFDADRAEEWSIDATVGWEDPATDLAVLVIDPPAERLYAPTVMLGSLGDRRADIPVHTAGFPRWKRRIRADGRQFRELLDATGTISGLTGRREDRLEISVQPPDDEQLRTLLLNIAEGRRPSGQENISPWEGMSGAAVWWRQYLIGIVTNHYTAEGLGRLSAIRIDHCLAHAYTRRDQLCGLLGISGADELTDVTVLQKALDETSPQHSGQSSRSERLYARYRRLLTERAGETLADLSTSPSDMQFPQRIVASQLEPPRAAEYTGSPQDAIRARKRVLVSGPAGIGKSHFMATALLSGTASGDDTIPIIVRLSEAGELGFTDIESGIEEYLKKVYRIPRDISRRLIQEEQLTIFLDGLDRLKPDVRLSAATSIAALAKTYGTTSIIVASRESGELDWLRGEFDLEFAIGSVPDDYAAAAYGPAVLEFLAPGGSLPDEFRTPFAIVSIVQRLGLRGDIPGELLAASTIPREAVADAYISACTAMLPDRAASLLIRHLGQLISANHRTRNSSIIQPDLIGPDWLSPMRKGAAVLTISTALWFWDGASAIVAGLPILVSETAASAITAAVLIAVAMGGLIALWAVYGGTQPADVLSSAVRWSLRDVLSDGGWAVALAAILLLGCSAVVHGPLQVCLGVMAVALFYAIGLGDSAPTDVLGTYSTRIRSATVAWIKQGTIVGVVIGGAAALLELFVYRNQDSQPQPLYLLYILIFGLAAGPLVARVRLKNIRPGSPRRTRNQWHAFYLMAIAIGGWFGLLISLVTSNFVKPEHWPAELSLGFVIGYAVVLGALGAAVLGASLRLVSEPALGLVRVSPFSPLRAERVLELAVTIGLARRVGVGYALYHDLVEDRIVEWSLGGHDTQHAPLTGEH